MFVRHTRNSIKAFLLDFPLWHCTQSFLQVGPGTPIRLVFANQVGLTLVYCTWISPQEVFSIKTSNDTNACSIILYIITERWPGAKKYRDTYEAIKQSLLESVEESEYEPRRAIRTLNPDLLPSMTRNDEGSAELSRMVADMAGEPMQADDDIFSGLSPAGMPGELTPNVNGMDINFSIPMDF